MANKNQVDKEVLDTLIAELARVSGSKRPEPVLFDPADDRLFKLTWKKDDGGKTQEAVKKVVLERAKSNEFDPILTYHASGKDPFLLVDNYNLKKALAVLKKIPSAAIDTVTNSEEKRSQKKLQK